MEMEGGSDDGGRGTKKICLIHHGGSGCWRSCKEVNADRGNQGRRTLERSLACSINYNRGMCSTDVWGEGPSRTR